MDACKYQSLPTLHKTKYKLIDKCCKYKLIWFLLSVAFTGLVVVPALYFNEVFTPHNTSLDETLTNADNLSPYNDLTVYHEESTTSKEIVAPSAPATLWLELEEIGKSEEIEEIVELEEIGKSEEIEEIVKLEEIGKSEEIEEIVELEEIEEIGKSEEIEEIGKSEEIEEIGKSEELEEIGKSEEIEKIVEI